MHANFALIEAVRKELYSTTSNTFMEIFPIEKKLICASEFVNELKKSIFCKYIVLIILQNEPMQLGDRQYACPYCNKIMKMKADVKRHIRTHTGEKPFACKFCPYRCIQKVQLTGHMIKNHSIISSKNKN